MCAYYTMKIVYPSFHTVDIALLPWTITSRGWICFTVVKRGEYEREEKEGLCSKLNSILSFPTWHITLLIIQSFNFVQQAS